MSRTACPHPSSAAVTAVMKANRKVGSRPEARLRSELYRRGFRFRKNFPLEAAGRRCRPDVVFLRHKVAVFVDGCFWHACPEHGVEPRVNREYWLPKLKRNVARDAQDDAALRAAGWTVVRIWEHEDAGDAAATVVGALCASFEGLPLEAQPGDPADAASPRS